MCGWTHERRAQPTVSGQQSVLLNQSRRHPLSKGRWVGAIPALTSTALSLILPKRGCLPSTCRCALTCEISSTTAYPPEGASEAYTELALTFSASWQINTCRRRGSVSLASSALALGKKGERGDKGHLRGIQASGGDERAGSGCPSERVPPAVQAAHCVGCLAEGLSGSCPQWVTGSS